MDKNQTILANFSDLPLGTRGGKKVWTIIRKQQYRDGGALHGTLAQWEPDMLTYGRWPGQSLCSHVPESEGGDCPEQVYPID